MSWKSHVGPIALLALGSLQMVGYLVGSPVLRGLGLAYVASPLPLVFSHFRGLETFAADFSIDVTTHNGEAIHVKMTPQLYAQLQGPYNRRNVYGALFSHGAMFNTPQEMALRDGILRYGLCNEGPLQHEFQLPASVDTATITVASKTAGKEHTFHYTIRCPA